VKHISAEGGEETKDMGVSSTPAVYCWCFLSEKMFDLWHNKINSSNKQELKSLMTNDNVIWRSSGQFFALNFPLRCFFFNMLGLPMSTGKNTDNATWVSRFWNLTEYPEKDVAEEELWCARIDFVWHFLTFAEILDRCTDFPRHTNFDAEFKSTQSFQKHIKGR
jgi:hypothetical protein